MSRREERKEIEVLEEILEVTEVDLGAIIARLDVVVAFLAANQSTTAVLGFDTISTNGGPKMATTATATFEDASGNPAAPPKGDGSGLTVTFSSDNPAVTLGAASASGDTATAPITGTEAFNLSCVVANVSGAELFDDDGVTAFVQPTTIAVPAVAPPQAVTATLSAS